MQKITSISQLKEAIRLLKEKQDLQGKLVKDQFYIFTESLKPVNLVKSAFRETITSPALKRNMLNIAIGIITSLFVARKIKGTHGNVLIKLFENILQIGIPLILANNQDALLSFGQNILQRIFSKKQETPDSN
jgi:hypothetical protein